MNHANSFELLLEDYHEQKECLYKGERYSVRDNGAVYRHKPQDKKKPRQLDEEWTFGRKCSSNGYMMISGHRVHIIVATAFLGPRNSKEYVVDHIDTNRCNNRIENLRWFTKLENALNNLTTRKRIEFLCGGDIRRFLEDPSCLNDISGSNQDLLWMRTVSSEEAKNAYSRIMRWTFESELSGSTKKKGIGEWIYTQPTSKSSIDDGYKNYTDTQTEELFESLSENAKQKNWKTPTLFPLCPRFANASLYDYKNNLFIGEIVSKNQYSTNYIDEFEINDDKLVIRSHADDGLKPFSVITISLVNESFIHEGTTFFDEDGAKKEFMLSMGKQWSGPESIDDYC
ncbi:MAG: HNH endonuclease [Muribaculaceae bacterium]|nr:HNH endonuclease [Muribaculaceae bacterium]